MSGRSGIIVSALMWLAVMLAAASIACSAMVDTSLASYLASIACYLTLIALFVTVYMRR